MMRNTCYLSLFSGIEAATTAWDPLGWECVAVSEIEPFPCAVLAHHYPDVPNLGDVTTITEEDIRLLGPIDVVVFGSPCQDLSVAGLRKGFICESTDTLTRSGLFFIAMRIVTWARKHCGCRYALWENVPGAFSSSKGRDFAAVVEIMAGLENLPVPPNGWGTEGVAVGTEGLVEWAVLDAQWFGVAQRRRRVFALADFGDWVNRPPILLESESLRGDSPPRREAGEVAPTIPARSLGGGGLGTDFDCDGGVIQTFDFQSSGEYGTANVAATLSARDYKSAKDLAVTHSSAAIAVRTAQTGSNGWGINTDGTAYTLDSAQQAIATSMQVRRLTPIECERLQGFPDDFTKIPWRNKPAKSCPDGPRYKALGNSMVVPVMAWIGIRIDFIRKFYDAPTV
jgi:DNA (cytosine-5)-methyltransferase 1